MTKPLKFLSDFTLAASVTEKLPRVQKCCSHCGHRQGASTKVAYPRSSPTDSPSLVKYLHLLLTCEHVSIVGCLSKKTSLVSVPALFCCGRIPLSESVRSFDQVGRRARADRRDHGAQHVHSALGHSHLDRDGARIRLALAVFTGVFAVTFAARVDALAHLRCGKGARLGHRRTFHVMLTCQHHMWRRDSGKSINCIAAIDCARKHYRTALTDARAVALAITAHRSILWPGLPAKRGDRVSEGLRA